MAITEMTVQHRTIKLEVGDLRKLLGINNRESVRVYVTDVYDKDHELSCNGHSISVVCEKMIPNDKEGE
jgi:hypothetical protein